MRIKYLLLFLSLSINVSAIEIDNFISGPICTDAKSFDWVCNNTKDIYITGQGRCTWDGEEKPCTWYGFQFDYKDNIVGSTINCSYELSEKGSSGNPSEVINENTSEGEYSFKIKDVSGHYFNPQYSLLATMEKKKSLVNENTICFINGKEIFSFNYTFHYPINNK